MKGIEYLNEFKGRLRPSLDVNTVRKDRNKELNYSDVATEYILSNSLTFEEIDKTMNKSIQRLDFEHNIGKNSSPGAGTNIAILDFGPSLQLRPILK